MVAHGVIEERSDGGMFQDGLPPLSLSGVFALFSCLPPRLAPNSIANSDMRMGV